MTNLESGKYWIQRANTGYPKPLIGVEYGPSPVKPILTEADDNVWSLEKLSDGNYTLALKTADYPRPIKLFDGKPLGFDDDVSTASLWSIKSKDGEYYTIKEVSGNKVWTAKNPKPNFPVTLDQLQDGDQSQLWKFNRLPDTAY